MKFVAWYSVLLGVTAACSFGCGSSATPPPKSTSPTGFTFQTLQGGFTSFGWTGAIAGVRWMALPAATRASIRAEARELRGAGP